MDWSAAGVVVAAVSAIVGLVWRLSAKVYQIEIWARDEFVRKTSFDSVVTRIEKGMGDLGDRIEGRLDKMDERIQKIPHH